MLFFGANSKPSDFNRDNDEEANRAMELNEQLNALIEFVSFLGEEYTTDDTLALLKMIENDVRLILIKARHLHYPKVLTTVVMYLTGEISPSEYKEYMTYWNNSDFPIKCDIRVMTKILIKAEEIFLEVLEKKQSRKLIQPFP